MSKRVVGKSGADGNKTRKKHRPMSRGKTRRGVFYDMEDGFGRRESDGKEQQTECCSCTEATVCTDSSKGQWLQFADGLADDTLCLLHRAIEPTAGCVEMATAVEPSLSHLGAREIINAAQTDPNEIVALRVFAQGDAQLEVLDLQRHVDQAFGISFHVMESLQVLACQREIAGPLVCEDLQLLIEYIANQAHSPFTVVVEYIPVYLVLVDALGQQLADNEINFRRRAVVREATCVCHHSAIEGDCGLFGHRIKPAQLPDDAEDKLTGAAQ